MSDYVKFGSRAPKIDYLPAVDLEKGDLVWIVWQHLLHSDLSRQAKPTYVIKVYDDGNILHKIDQYEDTQFCFAKDIYAKSSSNFDDYYRYRTVKLRDIQIALGDNSIGGDIYR